MPRHKNSSKEKHLSAGAFQLFSLFPYRAPDAGLMLNHARLFTSYGRFEDIDRLLLCRITT
jgi:hypothetical protein